MHHISTHTVPALFSIQITNVLSMLLHVYLQNATLPPSLFVVHWWHSTEFPDFSLSDASVLLKNFI
jgi:hypothetical protein